MSHQVAEFFDRFSDKFDTLYDGRRSFWMRWLDARFRSDILVRFAMTFEALGADLEGKSVLDIGCGSGPYVLEALERGASRVTAVDPAPGMLALLRKRLENAALVDRCSIVQGTFPSVQLPSHDYVIVQGVLDYVSDPVTFLGRLLPLVDDTAAVSFPSTHWFRTPFRKYRYMLRRCPVYFYTRHKISELASEAGWKSFEIRKIPGAGMDYHVLLRRR